MTTANIIAALVTTTTATATATAQKGNATAAMREYLSGATNAAAIGILLAAIAGDADKLDSNAKIGNRTLPSAVKKAMSTQFNNVTRYVKPKKDAKAGVNDSIRAALGLVNPLDVASCSSAGLVTIEPALAVVASDASPNAVAMAALLERATGIVSKLDTASLDAIIIAIDARRVAIVDAAEKAEAEAKKAEAVAGILAGFAAIADAAKLAIAQAAIAAGQKVTASGKAKRRA